MVDTSSKSRIPEVAELNHAKRTVLTYNGSLGRSLQRGPSVKPLVRDQGWDSLRFVQTWVFSTWMVEHFYVGDPSCISFLNIVQKNRHTQWWKPNPRDTHQHG